MIGRSDCRRRQMYLRRGGPADPALNQSIDAELSGTQDGNDKSEYGERQVQLVAGWWRRRVCSNSPGDGDHRHHHVPEEGDARQA